MISKELLSEVLALDVRELEYNEKHNFIRYGYWNSCINNQNEDISGIDYLKINIYELAYKCKEWAYDKGYYLTFYNDAVDIILQSNCKILENITDSSFKYSPALVLKACEWIRKKSPNLS